MVIYGITMAVYGNLQYTSNYLQYESNSQSEIYRRGNVENGWKSLIMVDHAWKCQ